MLFLCMCISYFYAHIKISHKILLVHDFQPLDNKFKSSELHILLLIAASNL